MRNFNYSEIRNQKWDSDILGFIVAIYKEAGKQLPCTRPWQADNFNGEATTSSHSLPVPTCTYQNQT